MPPGFTRGVADVVDYALYDQLFPIPGLPPSLSCPRRRWARLPI